MTVQQLVTLIPRMQCPVGNPLVGKADIPATQLPYYRCRWRRSGITFAKLRLHTEEAGKFRILPMARIFDGTDDAGHKSRLLAHQKLIGPPKLNVVHKLVVNYTS